MVPVIQISNPSNACQAPYNFYAECRLRPKYSLKKKLGTFLVCLYLRFPGAAWIEDEALGPGIAKLSPQYTTWSVDKEQTVKIERHGFFIASDFSGTAHSFQGANLQAAIIDCSSWDSGQNKPSKKESWPSIGIRYNSNM